MVWSLGLSVWLRLTNENWSQGYIFHAVIPSFFCVWLGTEQIMMIPALGQRGQSIKVGCTNR